MDNILGKYAKLCNEPHERRNNRDLFSQHFSGQKNDGGDDDDEEEEEDEGNPSGKAVGQVCPSAFTRVHCRAPNTVWGPNEYTPICCRGYWEVQSNSVTELKQRVQLLPYRMEASSPLWCLRLDKLGKGSSKSA